jgi:FdhD protein
MTEGPGIYEMREVFACKAGAKSSTQLAIVKEVPLTIMLDGQELATLMCSPHALELLAVGFLVSEGILQDRSQLKEMVCQPEERIVRVDTVDGTVSSHSLSKGSPANPARLNGWKQVAPTTLTPVYTVEELLALTALLDEQARTFRLTGGVHEAALANKDGLIVCYEDIGRHNALDRILGYTLLNNIDTSDKVVVLSGRIASEMLSKAARIGVPIVLSRSAPTCLSIDLAEQLGITIVGFARGDRLNVYAHPERVLE